MKTIKILLIGGYAVFSVLPIIGINYFLTGFLFSTL